LPNFHVPSGSPTTVGIRSNFDIGVETTRIVTGTMTTEDKLLNNNDGNTTTLTTSPTDFNTSTGSLRTTATMGIINTTTTNDVIPNGTPYPNSGCGVWIKRGSSLYYFITIKMQRTIAAMQCNSMAAHLAYIENAQEAALIAELVGNCSTAHNLFVWMGLTDVETEGSGSIGSGDGRCGDNGRCGGRDGSDGSGDDSGDGSGDGNGDIGSGDIGSDVGSGSIGSGDGSGDKGRCGGRDGSDGSGDDSGDGSGDGNGDIGSGDIGCDGCSGCSGSIGSGGCSGGIGSGRDGSDGSGDDSGDGSDGSSGGGDSDVGVGSVLK
ncbi:hypothetical protein BSL78_00647, partial [Apostichopus japonicus]